MTYVVTMLRGGGTIMLLRRVRRMAVSVRVRRRLVMRLLLMVGLAWIASIGRLLLVVMHRSATRDSVSYRGARPGTKQKRTRTVAGGKTAAAGDNPAHPNRADNKTCLKSTGEFEAEAQQEVGCGEGPIPSKTDRNTRNRQA